MRALGLLVLVLPLSCASAPSDDTADESAASSTTVITPFGRMKRACVHADGEGVSDPSCITSSPSLAPGGTTGDAEPAGWVAWADQDLASGVSFLQADFTVPPVPAKVSDQVIFLFPSLTPSTNPPIIQPVLQFGAAADGGGRYWSIASWYLDINANSHNSKVVKVNAGDKLRGTIQGTGTCKNGVCSSWTVTLADLTQPSLKTTLTTTAGGSKYTQIQGAALETYEMTSCANYPSKGVSFTNIIMKDNSGNPLTPKWNLFNNTTATPQCGFKATSPTPDEIDLSYTSSH